MTSEPQELELTADLLEYAKAVALEKAPKYCPRRLGSPRGVPSDLDEGPYDDVVQQVMLQLLSRPPKYDPSRGAKPKTLIYTIVVRALMKYGGREKRRAGRYPQMPETVEVSEALEEGKSEQTSAVHQVSQRRHADLTRSGWSMDDILQYVDSEDSRDLCELVIECDGNVSEAARRMGCRKGRFATA
ncbi:MAG: hypothetical protein JXL80_05860 [Planctomycetes bacterium]|nr:hypothetical protein [Planctomycetota bacterium]